MILFKQRKQIQTEYEQWLKNNPDILDCPFNVISFLAIKQWLNEEKINRDILFHIKN